MSHTLTYQEITSLPAGRIMDTFIEEYVVGDLPSRWSNAHQKQLPCHWFEEHPRSCAEDDGGYCSADGLCRYSTDVSRALALAQLPALKDKPLQTRVEGDKYWAAFSTVPFEKRMEYGRRLWVSASSLPLAICQAALVGAM